MDKEICYQVDKPWQHDIKSRKHVIKVNRHNIALPGDVLNLHPCT